MEPLMTLRFRVDGEIYQTVSVEKGELIMPIDAPAKEGHRFVRWDNLPEKSVAGKEATVDAVYEKLSYSVTFVLDGETRSQTPVAYGDPIAAPVAPEQKGRVFLGWKNIFRVNINNLFQYLYCNIKLIKCFITNYNIIFISFSTRTQQR